MAPADSNEFSVDYDPITGLPRQRRTADVPVPSIQSVFAQFDTNNSGFLDYGELRNALRAYGIDASEGDAANVVRAYDKVPDGKLELAEFAALIADLDQGRVKMASDDTQAAPPTGQSLPAEKSDLPAQCIPTPRSLYASSYARPLFLMRLRNRWYYGHGGGARQWHTEQAQHDHGARSAGGTTGSPAQGGDAGRSAARCAANRQPSG